MPIKISSRKPSPIKITIPKPPPPQITERLAASRFEAAQLLGVCERSIDKWTKQGKKVGTRVLIPVQSLQDLINGIEPTGNSE